MHCAQSFVSKAELEHVAKAYGFEGLFHSASPQHPSCPPMADTRCLHTKGVQETDWCYSGGLRSGDSRNHRESGRGKREYSQPIQRDQSLPGCLPHPGRSGNRGCLTLVITLSGEHSLANVSNIHQFDGHVLQQLGKVELRWSLPTYESRKGMLPPSGQDMRKYPSPGRSTCLILDAR